MKLIYIVNARIPTEKAHGLQIMKMCSAFVDSKFSGKNIEVELVVPFRFNYIKKDAFEYYDIERNFKIKKLPCLDLIPLDKYLGRWAFWTNTFSFLFFAFFYVLFKNPDTIYTRGKGILFLTLIKKNIFYESHGSLRNFFLIFLKRNKGIITITHHLKDFFVQKGIPKDKILVAPDGVNLEKFDIKETKEECRRKLNLPLDKKIVLYTGHLYFWKGADILARASVYLPERVEVYFVGGTKEDIKRFRSRYPQMNLASQDTQKHAENNQRRSASISVVGHRPHSEIPYWLKAADILILPSSAKDTREKYYTSPLKMFEYMASKRPMVASALPSIKEILNESNSLLVKSDSPEALAQGIKDLLENADFSAKISNQAFQDVQNYTWQKRAEKILEFIFNTLSQES